MRQTDDVEVDERHIQIYVAYIRVWLRACLWPQAASGRRTGGWQWTRSTPPARAAAWASAGPAVPPT